MSSVIFLKNFDPSLIKVKRLAKGCKHLAPNVLLKAKHYLMGKKTYGGLQFTLDFSYQMRENACCIKFEIKR